MTQKEFIKKFGIICDQNHTNGINLNDMDNAIQMRFDCYHCSEVINDCVSEIGFYEGDFYITFILSDFTAYEDELESNTEDDWSMLWEAVLNYLIVMILIFTISNQEIQYIGTTQISTTIPKMSVKNYSKDASWCLL